MATRVATEVFDCNSHVFEPAAVWEEHLAPEYRLLARSAFWHHIDADGLVSVILNGKAGKPMNRSRLIRQAIWRPGMTLDAIGGLDPTAYHPINPGASDPRARLRDMDAMGIRRALLLPTLFLEYFPVVENPDLAHALARAYNDWVLAFSTVDPARLIPAAVLPLQDVAFAVAEARRVANRGFKALALRPCYYNQAITAPVTAPTGRYLNHAYYRPLWAELETLGLAAFLTPSPGSTNPEWTSEGSFVDRIAGALRIGHDIAESVAPVMDNHLALNAFAFYGHMEDYPRLKLGFAGGGAAWAPLALEKAETRLAHAAHVRDVSLEPERIFLERPSLVAFDSWETLVPRMLEFFGDVAAWGSRYPQHDTTTPEEAAETLARYGAPDAAVAKLMGGNAARFLGL